MSYVQSHDVRGTGAPIKSPISYPWIVFHFLRATIAKRRLVTLSTCAAHKRASSRDRRESGGTAPCLPYLQQPIKSASLQSLCRCLKCPPPSPPLPPACRRTQPPSRMRRRWMLFSWRQRRRWAWHCCANCQKSQARTETAVRRSAPIGIKLITYPSVPRRHSLSATSQRPPACRVRPRSQLGGAAQAGRLLHLLAAGLRT
jgi:hypothetical protein